MVHRTKRIKLLVRQIGRLIAVVFIFTSCIGLTGPEVNASIDPSICLERIPIAKRIGQLLLPLIAKTSEAESALKQALITGLAPTGTIRKEDAERIQKLRSMNLPFGVLVASDEEGGPVQRYRAVIKSLPSASAVASSLTLIEARRLYAAYATELRDWGVDIVFGPVLDVGGGPGIGVRAFSSDATIVTRYGRVAAAAFSNAGITPVFKHFPGHGSANRDSHNGVSTTARLSHLSKRDLLPYQLLKEFPNAGVMIGHLVVPGTTYGLPSSMSEPIIKDLLRDSLNFQGLVFSDALGMGAISKKYTNVEAATAFLNAGGDVVVVSSVKEALQLNNSIRSLISQGIFSEMKVNHAVLRVLIAKGVDVCTVAGSQESRS